MWCNSLFLKLTKTKSIYLCLSTILASIWFVFSPVSNMHAIRIMQNSNDVHRVNLFDCVHNKTENNKHQSKCTDCKDIYLSVSVFHTPSRIHSVVKMKKKYIYILFFYYLIVSEMNCDGIYLAQTFKSFFWLQNEFKIKSKIDWISCALKCSLQRFAPARFIIYEFFIRFLDRLKSRLFVRFHFAMHC